MSLPTTTASATPTLTHYACAAAARRPTPPVVARRTVWRLRAPMGGGNCRGERRAYGGNCCGGEGPAEHGASVAGGSAAGWSPGSTAPRSAPTPHCPAGCAGGPPPNRRVGAARSLGAHSCHRERLPALLQPGRPPVARRCRGSQPAEGARPRLGEGMGRRGDQPVLTPTEVPSEFHCSGGTGGAPTPALALVRTVATVVDGAGGRQHRRAHRGSSRNSSSREVRRVVRAWRARPRSSAPSRTRSAADDCCSRSRAATTCAPWASPWSRCCACARRWRRWTARARWC